MLCQKCHKNLATMRYAEVVDGKVTEQHLCATCMAAHEAEAAGFALSGVTPRLQKPAGDQIAQEALRAQRTCPACGAVLRLVLDEGTVGCGGCYVAFGNEIEAILEGLHPALRHKGKTLRQDDTRARLRSELQSKRALLRSMLRAENYEEAAALRDAIREIETRLFVSESSAERTNS